MLAKECMTKNVKIGNPNESIVDAARYMKDGDFGFLPIGENDRLVGTLTDRDIAIRCVAEGKDPKSCKVRDVMSQGIHYCFEDQDIDEITRNFANHQLRRLPVLNRDKRLVGVLSLGDVSQSNVDPNKMEETLAQISKPSSGRQESRIQ